MKKRIAVAYENGQVYQHFGHTSEFKIYTAEDGKFTETEIVPTNGSGHGALADFLVLHGVTTVICGGIGGGAKAALAQKGIELRGGVSGNADERAAEYLAGTLAFNADIECSHHHEHGHGHEGCVEHGCGGH